MDKVTTDFLQASLNHDLLKQIERLEGAPIINLNKLGHIFFDLKLAENFLKENCIALLEMGAWPSLGRNVGGASPSSENFDPLVRALCNRKVNIAELIITHYNGDVDKCFRIENYVYAVKNGLHAVRNAMIDSLKRSDESIDREFDGDENINVTLLLSSCLLRDCNEVSALLKLGADPNYQIQNGVYKGMTAAYVLLLSFIQEKKNGAAPNSEQTAKVLVELLKHGADFPKKLDHIDPNVVKEYGDSVEALINKNEALLTSKITSLLHYKNYGVSLEDFKHYLFAKGSYKLIKEQAKSKVFAPYSDTFKRSVQKTEAYQRERARIMETLISSMKGRTYPTYLRQTQSNDIASLTAVMKAGEAAANNKASNKKTSTKKRKNTKKRKHK